MLIAENCQLQEVTSGHSLECHRNSILSIMAAISAFNRASSIYAFHLIMDLEVVTILLLHSLKSCRNVVLSRGMFSRPFRRSTTRLLADVAGILHTSDRSVVSEVPVLPLSG